MHFASSSGLNAAAESVCEEVLLSISLLAGVLDRSKPKEPDFPVLSKLELMNA